MRKIIILLFCMIVLSFGANANADPTVTESGGTVEVSAIDADFTYSTSCMMYGKDGSGVRMDWIQFIPGTAWGTGTLGCYVTVKDGSDAGPTILYSQACDLGSDFILAPVYFHGAKVRPVIDFSASSVGHDSSKVIFQLWPQQ